ncbi:pentapeptide repeat-containing protein [Candidatus Pantoea multigeneris]|uniref:Pentapeptide repeat-containing protein n=1 Tax=Candidatus Pantoea multigeneris TaxID=2608357 RepID=A0ABX0R5K9_9GAMM|nr:pentapeptide repeat-containing protein [Pantoea multigeneris]NIF20382.1 pentapeptide repeat-containing protein [Pantoea multigeneris]
MTNLLISNQEYSDEDFKDIKQNEDEIVNTRFDNCTFTHCNFTESTFRKCSFFECEFNKCNLSLLNVSYSSFRDVTFHECKLVGIDWTRAAWSTLNFPAALNFHHSVLNDSVFFGLYLAQCSLIECKLQAVDFSEAQCEEADFSGSDLTHATFHHTRLTGANFAWAHGYNINVLNNEVKNARFTLPEAATLLTGLGIEIIDE